MKIDLNRSESGAKGSNGRDLVSRDKLDTVGEIEVASPRMRCRNGDVSPAGKT